MKAQTETSSWGMLSAVLNTKDPRRLFRQYVAYGEDARRKFDFLNSTLAMQLILKEEPTAGIMWAIQESNPKESTVTFTIDCPEREEKQEELYFSALFSSDDPGIVLRLPKTHKDICTFTKGTVYVQTRWTEEVQKAILKEMGFSYDSEEADITESSIKSIISLYLGPMNNQQGDELGSEIGLKTTDTQGSAPEPKPEPCSSPASAKRKSFKFKLPEKFDEVVKSAAGEAMCQEDFIKKVADIIGLSYVGNEVFKGAVEIAKTCDYDSRMIRECLPNQFGDANIKQFLKECYDGIKPFYPEETPSKGIRPFGVLVTAVEKYVDQVGSHTGTNLHEPPGEANEGEKLPDHTQMRKILIPLLGTELDVGEGLNKEETQRAILEEIGCEPDLVEAVMAVLENPDKLGSVDRMKLGVEILGPYCSKKQGCKKPTAIDFVKALSKI